jgi:hypothetical protein
MNRYVLTFGFILQNNQADFIYCGDKESSQTVELNFELLESKIIGLDNDFNYPCTNNLLWDSESVLYAALSTFMTNFGIIIEPKLIYAAYSLVNDEPDEGLNTFEIIDSSAGVFSNKDQQYNGKFFLRQYFEEEGEIYDEKICISIKKNK